MYAFEFKTKCSSCGKAAITQSQNWKCGHCNKYNKLNFKKLDESKLAIDDGKAIDREPVTPPDQPIQVPSVKLPYWVEPKTLTYIFVTISSVFLLFYIMLIPNDTGTVIALIPYLIGIVAIVVITGIIYNCHLTRSIAESKRIISDHYKKYITISIVLLLILTLIPTSNSQILITNAETSNARSIEASDNTTVNNSFARGGSRNIVRGIDNNFYYFWHNTTDLWCSVVTKNGPDLSAGAPLKLVGGTNGIIQNTGLGTEVHGLSVDINTSRTEIYIIWSFYSTIADTSALLFSKCTDLTNIDQTASWKAINDGVGYDSIITSSGYIYQGLSIALNGSSIPHIVWHEFNGVNTINYTTVKSNAWQAPIRIAQNNSNFGRLWNPIIDINRTNVAHIFWGNTSSATDIGWVNHTYCDTTANDPMVLANWNLEAGPMLENINTTGFSQAIDRDNDIWLAGVNETNDLQINILNGTTWLNGTGENISFPHIIENISLGADTNGTIYLGYTDETNDDIRHATSMDWFSTNTKIADYGTYAGITIEKRSKYDKWSLGLGWVNGSNFEEIHFENLTVVPKNVWWNYAAYSGKEGYETILGADYDMAAQGSYIHIVWRDKRIDNSNCHIYYRRSNDHGVTWIGDYLLSKYNTSSEFPVIDVNGSSLHVAFSNDTKVLYINSTNSGQTWSKQTEIDDAIEGTGAVGVDMDIAVNDVGMVHLVYNKDENLTYTNSSDDGISFITPKVIMSSSRTRPNNVYAYYRQINMEVSGENVAIIAQFDEDWTGGAVPSDDTDINFTRSIDNGTTWSTEMRFDDYGGMPYSPDVAINDSNIYVTYIGGSGGKYIVFNKSADLGTTWQTTTTKLIETASGVTYYAPSVMVNSTGLEIVVELWSGGANGIYNTTSSDNGQSWVNGEWATRNAINSSGGGYYPKLDIGGAIDEDSRNVVYVWWDGQSPPNDNSYIKFLGGWLYPLSISNPLPNFNWHDDMWYQHWYGADNISGTYAWVITTNATQTNCTHSINSQTGYMRLIPNGPGESWWFNITITDEAGSDFNNFTLTCLMSPPYPGDWWVYDNQTKTNETLPLRGNLTVCNGKTLTLDNITLEINCTFDTEFHIWVWGNLVMNNTTITINYTTYFYNFTILANGSAMITNSTIEFVYNGIHILSDNVLIDNTTIRFNYGDGLLIENCSPVISYNEIYSNTENGITANNATPTIMHNTIQHNLWSGMAINYSTITGLSNNTIYHNKVGIYIYNSTVSMEYNTIKKSISIGLVVEINSTCTGNHETFNNNLVQVTVHNLSVVTLIHSGFGSSLSVSQPDFDFVVEGTLTLVSTSISTLKDTIFHIYNGSVIISNSSIATNNIYTAELEWNSTIILVNTTILDNYNFGDSTNSTVIVQYYLHIYVLDNHGGVDNATINITQSNGTRIMTNGLTNSAGWYKNIILTEYITNATTKVMQTPHIIVVKNGTKVHNRSLTMDKTRTLIIDFSNTLVFNLVQNQWNLIGISKDLSTTYTAGDLVALGCSKVIYRDTSGAYKPYIYEGGKYYGSDFTIYSYKSYFVYYTKSTSLRLSGTERSGAVTLALVKGYNMVAVPHSGISTLDIIQDVEGAKNVLVRRNGQYKPFSISSSPNSAFFLNENEGVYVYVDKSTSWTIK